MNTFIVQHTTQHRIKKKHNVNQQIMNENLYVFILREKKVVEI